MIKGKLYRLMELGIGWLGLVLTGVLFLSGFLGTAYVMDMDSQKVLFRWDNVLINLLMVFLVIAVVILSFRVVKKGTIRKKVLLYGALIWYFVAGVFLAIFGRTVPAADAMSVYQIAESLSVGDLSVIDPAASYLSYYPHQLGLSTFLAICLFFIKWIPIGIEGFHFIKIIYTVFICIILYFSYKIVDGIWKNDDITCIYLLLSICNFPMIIYSSFVYGEVPGYCAFVIGIYYFMKLVQQEKTSLCSFLLSLFFITMSVWLRKNMMIMLIGVVIICIGLFCHTNKKRWIVYGALYLSMSLLVPRMGQTLYEYAAGRELRDGVTSFSYFAMGMQEASRGPGWYNGFNFLTYQENGMDAELTNQISKKAIAERMTEFSQEPLYAMEFYGKKYLSQWTDGTYACRQAVLADYGGRMPFIREVYAGKYSPYFIGFCNQLQNMIYFGAFVWSIVMFKRVRTGNGNCLPKYLGMVIVLGGLLFHMMWEANGRYILLYGQILYFYAASGLYTFGKMLCSKYADWKGKHA